MSKAILYALKIDNVYVSKGGLRNLVTLSNAWLLKKEEAEKMAKYHPDCRIVPIRLKEVEDND